MRRPDFSQAVERAVPERFREIVLAILAGDREWTPSSKLPGTRKALTAAQDAGLVVLWRPGGGREVATLSPALAEALGELDEDRDRAKDAPVVIDERVVFKRGKPAEEVGYWTTPDLASTRAGAMPIRGFAPLPFADRVAAPKGRGEDEAPKPFVPVLMGRVVSLLRPRGRGKR